MGFVQVENTPPTEGIGISWGVGGSVRPKNLKKCVKLYWNFHGGVLEKIPSVGRYMYGYFLELHNVHCAERGTQFNRYSCEKSLIDYKYLLIK